MGDLSNISDSEELENRYLDKTIIYVEGEPDEKIYGSLVPNHQDRIEFKVPAIAGSGCAVVIARVAAERPRNSKVFGLLDGEEAASRNGIDALVDCKGAVFKIDGADNDGLLFLSGHELENLLILYGEFCEHIRHDVTLRDIGKYSLEQVKENLIYSTKRFFTAALIKYVSRKLNHAGAGLNILDTGRFNSTEKLSNVLAYYRVEVERVGINWSDFRIEMKAIVRLIKQRFTAEEINRQGQNDHFIRLADGKGLLTRMKKNFKGSTWDGHLAASLYKSSYANDFERDILAMTGA